MTWGSPTKKNMGMWNNTSEGGKLMGPFLEIIWSPNTVFNNSIVSAAACGAGGSGSTVEGNHLVKKKKKKNSSNICL